MYNSTYQQLIKIVRSLCTGLAVIWIASCQALLESSKVLSWEWPFLNRYLKLGNFISAKIAVLQSIGTCQWACGLERSRNHCLFGFQKANDVSHQRLLSKLPLLLKNKSLKVKNVISMDRTIQIVGAEWANVQYVKLLINELKLVWGLSSRVMRTNKKFFSNFNTLNNVNSLNG